MAEEEEGGGPRRVKTQINDPFLRLPYTGAYVRNPLGRSRSGQLGIVRIAECDYKHNSLDDALGSWNCVSLSESAFNRLVRKKDPIAQARGRPPSGSLSRIPKPTGAAAISRIHDLSEGFDFLLTVRKSDYVPRRTAFRGPPGMGKKDKKDAKHDAAAQESLLVENVGIEVCITPDRKSLRIDFLGDGLVEQWNRAKPHFAARMGDHVVRVNEVFGDGDAMLKEVETADRLRMTIRRAQARSNDERRTHVMDEAVISQMMKSLSNPELQRKRTRSLTKVSAVNNFANG